MRHRTHRVSSPPRPRALPTLLACLGVAACSSAGGVAVGSGSSGDASEAVWRSLAAQRPAPLEAAPRITVGEVQVNADGWLEQRAVDAGLGFSELIVAGLLRRRDVHFIERRRFAAAAQAARMGTLSDGAPPVGVSMAPEFVLLVTWSSFGLAEAYLEMRLTNPESGAIERSWRETTPTDADPVGLARTVVGSLVAELAAMDRAPAWSDPRPGAAPMDFVPTGIGSEPLDAYLSGLAAEELWQWEAARRGYQRALAADPGFFEAEVALARTARLRLGGTLGGS